MKHILLISLFFCWSMGLAAQKKKQSFITLAISNSQPAMPFSKFSRLLFTDLHPGAEAGLAFNWKTKKKHDWIQEFKAGYFYHRFVQHAIPLYTNLGYRYKFSTKISAEGLVGGGYLHSIPATAKYKLDENGEYRNNKGVGRMQAMANLTVRVSYTISMKRAKPLRVFSQYQQQLQMPFVRSYVPLLPYNIFMLGASWPLKKLND